MSIGTTAVEICTSALVRLGENPISSLSGSSDAEVACNNIYTHVKENYLSLYNWRFSMARKQLAKDSTTPNSQWKYRYPLPPDAVSKSTITVYHDSAEGVTPYKRFDVFENFLWTDAEEIFIVYQVDAPEAIWANYFVELMILAMAAELAFVVTDQQSTAQIWSDKRDKQFAVAKNRDAQHIPTRMKTSSRVISGRFRAFS